MASNLNFNFNKNSAPKAAGAPVNDQRPKADLWINIGYHVTYEVDGEQVTKFVSIPVGIPLDTIEELAVRGNNEEWKALQSARNNLLQQLISAGKELKPGEEIDIDQLVIQLRRVNEEAAPVDAADNPLVKELTFGKKAA